MKIVVVSLLVLISASGLLAQTTTSMSAFDGLTPEGLQPGSPAGAYVLSGLDTVNLYNGFPNLSIPLLPIGGRGDAGFTLSAGWGFHWDGVGVFNDSTCTITPCWGFSPVGVSVGNFVPASLTLRHLGQGTHEVISGGTLSCKLHADTLTRVVVALQDGTEVTLVDALSGGRPQSTPASCSPIGFDRGTAFVATDGSAMTFIADTPVQDSTNDSPVPGDNLSGTLYFRDGRQFHFRRTTIGGYDLPAIDRIQDRNGNRTTFTYNVNVPGFPSAFSITDPLGRVTTVAGGKPYTFIDDPFAGCTASTPCSGVFTEIAYNGAGAQPRTIAVYYRPHWYDRIAALRTAMPPADLDLFGGFSAPDNRQFVWSLSKIVLPDGHAYQFQYNQYAEVARIDLPTGGRYEFDWTNGPGTDTFEQCTANPELRCPIVRAPLFLTQTDYPILFAVYRRLKERREYANGGTAWTRRTTYDAMETAGGEAVMGDPLNQCGSTSNPQFVSGVCTKVTVRDYDPQSLLSSEDHYFYGAVSKYQSLFPQAGWYPWWLEGKEFRTDTLKPSGRLLREELQSWQQRMIPSWWFSGIGPQPALDPRIDHHDAILDNGKMARKTLSYSPSENTNNVVDLREYDYGNSPGSVGLLLRRTHTDFNLTLNNPLGGVYLRDVVSGVQVYDASDIVVSQTEYRYDESPTTGVSGIVQNVPLGPQRGNRTRIRRWRNTDGAWLETTFMYDVAGNVLSRRNPRGFPRNYTYTNCTGMDAFLSTVTNEALQTTTATHDCTAGVVTSILDPNQYQTRAFYGGQQDGGMPDPLDRLSKVIHANGRQSTYRYGSDLKTVTAASDQDSAGPNPFTAGDQLMRTVTFDDGFGRNVETRVYTSASTYISTKKDLDALGRTAKAYNPVEMTDGQSYTNTDGTRTGYDALGRVATITYADGAQETFSWFGDTVTHTDPAGITRRQQMDALDRIVAVTEDPAGKAFLTTYTYDALDNLITVVQGAQTRSFTYNSLQQLRSTTNPEVGAVVPCGSQTVSECYSYDTQPPNDTLKTKVAGGVTTTFTYDALDRVLSKSYSDGTPTVTYTYDLSQVGCLYSVSNSTATTTFNAYGPECVVLGSTQSVGNQSYPFSYGHNLAGALTSEVYPSGRVVSYHYDRAGRSDRVANGYLTSSNSFATNIAYAPHGAIRSMQVGVTTTTPGWLESWLYNNRLQPTALTVAGGILSLGFAYCPNGAFSCTTNNGNLVQQTITRSGLTWTQNYLDTLNKPAYDSTNRLTAARETISGGAGWTETYDYDRYGNRWLTSYPGLPAPNAETPTAAEWYLSNNRIAAWQYNDSRGNITAMPFMQRSFIYDAENRQTSATVNGVTAAYSYDGEGRRIRKTANGSTTTYVYDALGRLAAEYSTQPASTSGTQYRHVDHLGSTRLVLTSTGTPAPSGCHDFRPFGQELLAGTNARSATCFPSAPASGLEFTGKERDAESGLDYFMARYYSGSQGRFMSPDPKQFPFDIAYPQSWNKYAYSRNNPLRYVDPDGRDWFDIVNGVANAWASDNLIGAGRVSTGNSDYKRGQAIGDTAATIQGAIETGLGSGGEIVGFALDLTGAGAAAGIPINVATAGIIAHGGATAATGFTHLIENGHEKSDSPMAPKVGESGGPGAGRSFSEKTKADALQQNRTVNRGEAHCVFCGDKVGLDTKNKINIDHAQPKVKGGNNTLNNANVTCEYCNKSKGVGLAPKNPKLIQPAAKPICPGQNCPN